MTQGIKAIIRSVFVILIFICGSYHTSSAISLISPVNGYQYPDYSVHFRWNSFTTITSYRIVVATDNLFANKLFDNVVNGTETMLTFDTSVTELYWKVLSNDNYAKATSPVYRLTLFTPVKYNDVLVWLSADRNITLNPADSTISLWEDRTDNNLDAVQPVVSSQPTLRISSPLLNNKPVIRVDGINDFLNINAGGDIGSAYALFNFNSTGVFPNFNGLITQQTGSESGIIFIGEGGSSKFYISNGTCFPGVYINQSGINLFSPLQKFKVVSAYKTVAPTAFSNFIIGAERSNGRYWDGDIAEIILSKNNSSVQSDNIHTYLYNKYAPPVAIKDTVIGTSFCSPVTIKAPNNYTDYLWSNGNITQSISVTPNQAYSVTVKDIFGRESFSSFNVFPYKRLNNKTVYICKGDTLKLDLKTPPGFTALWNNGATTTTLNITQTGQYSVKITDASSCFVNDTINVVVDEPKLSPVPDISNNLTLCEGQKLFLTAPTSFDSILWSTGSTENFIIVTAPGNYSVYGNTASGCVINKSINVTIAGKAPTASFSIAAACQNAATGFADLSVPPSGNTIVAWKWNFSNNASATSQNTSTVFATAGTATASLKITTNVGCTDSVAKIFTVNKRPTASFYNLLSCAKNPTTFVDQSLANAASITNWQWDFAGLGTSELIQNPSFRFPSADSYDVRLTVTNSNSCRDSVVINTIVNPSPVAEFSFDSACGRSPISFQFLASVPAPNTITVWSWDFGDFETENAIKSPQHSYDEPGTYDVQLIVRSSNQCIDTVVKTVKVFDFPVVDFDISQTQCVGKAIQFTDISSTPDGTPINKWNWFFSGQGTSSEQNPVKTFNAEGNYTIQLTASNAVGCSGTKLRSVAVSSLPTPKFTFTPQNGLPPLLVTYNNQSTSGGNYLWNYGDGGGFIAGFNPPNHTYTVKGTYPIQLVATDFRGCTDTLTKYILVDKAYLDGVMVSVTITPNGDYYQVKATILNNSNVQITSLGLSLQLGGGAIIRENWTGSLLPGETVVYSFAGEIKLAESSQIPVVCAGIDNINGNAPEDRTDNNSTCKEARIGDFDVLNVYPNPAYENINFGVMVPRSGKVSIRFINYLGKILYTKEFEATPGYNNFSMTTMPLAAAAYIAEVYYDGNVIRKKFVRNEMK